MKASIPSGQQTDPRPEYCRTGPDTKAVAEPERALTPDEHLATDWIAADENQSPAEVLRMMAVDAKSDTDWDVRAAVNDLVRILEHPDGVAAILEEMAVTGDIKRHDPFEMVAITPTQKRAVVERVFPLLRPEVTRVMMKIKGTGKKAFVSMATHCENARVNKVQPYKMQRKNGYSEMQQMLQDVTTPAQLMTVFTMRRIQIFETLSDKYMEGRACALRRWIWLCIEGFQTSPWRLNWPKDEGDDELFLAFSTESSIRFGDAGTVKAANQHVISFHFTHLDVMGRPSLPRTEFFVSKVAKTLAKENPLGRKPGGGWNTAQMKVHLVELKAMAVHYGNSSLQGQEYAVIYAAIVTIYFYAARAGEFAPGDEFDADRGPWTKATVAALLQDWKELEGQLVMFLPQPPKKTELTSSWSRELCNKPLVMLLTDESEFSVRNALVMMEAFCHTDWSTADETPVFLNPRSGVSLSIERITETLRALEDRRRFLPPSVKAAAHDLRRSRLRGFEQAGIQIRQAGGGSTTDFQDGAAGAGLRQLMALTTTHATAVSHLRYDATTVQQELQLYKFANDTDFDTVKCVAQFDKRDRGTPGLVTMAQDGDNLVRSEGRAPASANTKMAEISPHRKKQRPGKSFQNKAAESRGIALNFGNSVAGGLRTDGTRKLAVSPAGVGLMGQTQELKTVSPSGVGLMGQTQELAVSPSGVGLMGQTQELKTVSPAGVGLMGQTQELSSAVSNAAAVKAKPKNGSGGTAVDGVTLVGSTTTSFFTAPFGGGGVFANRAQLSRTREETAMELPGQGQLRRRPAGRPRAGMVWIGTTAAGEYVPAEHTDTTTNERQGAAMCCCEICGIRFPRMFRATHMKTHTN